MNIRKIVALILFTILALTACSSHSSKPAPKPVGMAGTWVYPKGDSDLNFDTVVKDGRIRVVVQLSDSKGLYWEGSAGPVVDNGFESVPSSAENIDRENSLYGSLSRTKIFRFDGQHLSFEFSIMGVTRVIVLEKA